MPDFPSSGTPAAVWGYATRNLNSDANNAIRDGVLSDATKIAGVRVEGMPAFEAAIETDVTMTGAENILVEKTDDKISLLDGFVDLTTMAGGDTIIIRQYMKIAAAGVYVKYAEETYSGAQSLPLLNIVTKTSKTSIKVTAQQTAGVNRTLPVQFYRRLIA
jgi:hypothetical protein